LYVCAFQERNAQTKGVRREQDNILKKYYLQGLIYYYRIPYMSYNNNTRKDK